MEDLGKRLWKVMDELGLETPKDLSVFCGVSEGLVSQWFSGRTKLGPKPLKAFSRTNFSLDWITSGKLPKYRLAYKNGDQEPPDNEDVRISAAQISKLIELFGKTTDEGRLLILEFAKDAPKTA